jgi:hypothetical protein
MSSKEEILRRNLEELEKRVAMYGPGKAPLFLVSQIAELREQLGLKEDEDAPKISGESKPGDERQPDVEPFILQVSQPADGSPQVQVQQSWAGESAPHPLELPYSADELKVVLKALATPVGKLPQGHFDADETHFLERLGAVASGYRLQRAGEIVGQRLYEALFPPPVAQLFHTARSQAGAQHQALLLRLVFDANAAGLAAYPWELINEDVPLVADGVVDLVRYILLSRPQSAITVEPPLKVLGISPRPRDLRPLSQRAESEAIAEGLSALSDQRLVEITWLSSPTRQALVDALRHQDVHIVHFDGHGTFGRLCPSCHIPHTPTSKQCTRCEYPLSTVDPQGHLAFEKKDGTANYVSARRFANALSHSQVQLAVLSACQSGEVGGRDVFSGVGPALIQAGIPAVVAMQLAIPMAHAVPFGRALYTSLADFSTLVDAVGHGRQQLYDESYNPQTWFIPAVYLRSRDPWGTLFQAT